MEKKKNLFVLKLLDNQCAGPSPQELDKALDTLGRFALKGTLEKMDQRDRSYRIPIEDCGIMVSVGDKSASLTISTPPSQEQMLASTVAEVYQDLQKQINQYGVGALITAGRQTYG